MNFYRSMTVTYGIVVAIGAASASTQLGETTLSAALNGFVLGVGLGLAFNLAATGLVWPATDNAETLRVD
jgi:hypothetical protein